VTYYDEIIDLKKHFEKILKEPHPTEDTLENMRTLCSEMWAYSTAISRCLDYQATNPLDILDELSFELWMEVAFSKHNPIIKEHFEDSANFVESMRNYCAKNYY